MRRPSDADDAPLVDINTTPLVDVLLVLLVMLILTIPVQWRALTLDLPGDAPPPPAPPPVVQLDLWPTAWVWDGEVLQDRAQLRARLATAAGQRPQPEVHIAVHPAALQHQLVATLADARSAGIQAVGLVGR